MYRSFCAHVGDRITLGKVSDTQGPGARLSDDPGRGRGIRDRWAILLHTMAMESIPPIKIGERSHERRNRLSRGVPTAAF